MPLPLVEIPEPTPSEDIDEEILEIFLEEAEEVLEDIKTNFAQWKNHPADKDSLGNLRRSFHTLKGSGRMVGAVTIGELGWAFESMLNRVIDGTMSSNSTMLKLIDQVEPMMPGLIEEFKNGQAAGYDSRLLISQTNHLTETKGAELGEFESLDEASASSAQPAPEVIEPEAVAATPVEAQPATPQPVAPEIEEAAIAEFDPAVELDDSLSEDLEDLELDDLGDLEDIEDLDSIEVDDLELPSLDDSVSEIEVAVEETDIPELSTEDLAASTDDELPDFEEDSEEEDVDLIQEELEDDEIDPALVNIFKSEAETHLNSLKTFIIECRKNPPGKITDEAIRLLHTLNGSSRSVKFFSVSNLAAPMEKYARTAMERQMTLTNDVLKQFAKSGKLLEQMLNQNGRCDDPAEHDALVANWEKLTSVLLSKETNIPSTVPKVSEPAPEPVDNGDEFMEIFIDEAEEILETCQSLVGRWQSAPDNMPLLKELQRELHTLKGGSRMVGIKAMGDLSHELESVLTRIVEGNAQPNPKLQAIVEQSIDQLAIMLEDARNGQALAIPYDLIQQIASSLDGGKPATPQPEAETKPEATTSEASAASQQKEKAPATESQESESPASQSENEERVRVRAGLIDKMTNLAGELSISRAHMEQQQGTMKVNLGEMEQTVMRLRDLLRRLEIETEAQIISHFGEVVAEDDEEFDPLEMDRFSVMQQLSRSLMETVSDLQNIEETMQNLARHSDSLLIQQSRIGAELQDNIMRTRMIPFSQISPRLQRIARLTSRELHKKVKFEIINGDIEFERTVLNRVIAPLEHMLRNAIGHGIESPDDRTQSGKPAEATVSIELAREGAELLLFVRDDGAGINIEAIRAKAEERGMLQPGAKISEEELMQFILQPAFSTAKKITQVSGRGVGMDIVNSEIKQLGGALRISSVRGKGTTFEIRLPLSLTISQALLVHIGEETMAVPLHNVDAILRIPRDEIPDTTGGEANYHNYMGQQYLVAHLGEMLGFGRLSSVDSSMLPMLLLHSGNQRVALLVDSIEGGREVVVKSVGPQLGSIRWIAGATILGDGRVVLILDVLTLLRSAAAMEPLEVEMVEAKEEKPQLKTIMVVDDSITVRKVTARLLKRQGMEVITAKDGLDAVTQLQDHIPDLMLLDVEMPRMDGFELAQRMRNNDDWKNIPIIMITSRTGTKHRERAAKIGIDKHLGKPFNESELLEHIHMLLNRKAEEQRESV